MEFFSKYIASFYKNVRSPPYRCAVLQDPCLLLTQARIFFKKLNFLVLLIENQEWRFTKILLVKCWRKEEFHFQQ